MKAGISGNEGGGFPEMKAGIRGMYGRPFENGDRCLKTATDL